MAAKRRLLLFPFLAHGHVSPFLQLAKMLSRTNNFDSFLCSTPVILDSLTNSPAMSGAPVELIPLHLPDSSQLPPHRHTTKDLPPSLIPTLLHDLQKSTTAFADLIEELRPDLVVYDVFVPWAAEIASSRGIPAVFFLTSSSTAVGFIHHSHKNSSSFPFPGIFQRDYEKMDMRSLIGSFAHKAKEGDGFWGSLFKVSSGIALAKSCKCLEGKYTDHLSTVMEKKIVCVGPLVTQSSDASSDPEILQFLDQKQASSTVYISLGSENYFSEDQIKEIAKGLELTTVNFIWVARSPAGSDNLLEQALPEGFAARTGTRGMIVQRWVPQTAILGHPSVGAFVSHCGWSSITESIYFGVPVIALPLKFDQPMNARLVVELGVGVEIEKDEKGRFDGEAVAAAVKEVVVEESGGGFRSRAAELSRKMRIEEEEACEEVAKEINSRFWLTEM